MEARVLEGDRRLVGEQAQRPPVGRGERADAAAALLVPHRQQTARAAVDIDRHPQQVARPRQQLARRRRALAGQEGAQLAALRSLRDLLAFRAAAVVPGRGVAAERPLQPVAAAFEDVERAAAGVEQRHGAQQDLLRELLEIESGGHRQPDVVERLELHHAVIDLELLVLDLLAQAQDLERGEQQQRQRPVLGAGSARRVLRGHRVLRGRRARREEEAAAGEPQHPQVRAFQGGSRRRRGFDGRRRGLAAVHSRQPSRPCEAGRRRGHLELEPALPLEVHRGEGDAVREAPVVQEALEQGAVGRLVLAQRQQLPPGFRRQRHGARASRRHLNLDARRARRAPQARAPLCRKWARTGPGP